jgi:predicted outer membrane protein
MAHIHDIRSAVILGSLILGAAACDRSSSGGTASPTAPQPAPSVANDTASHVGSAAEAPRTAEAANIDLTGLDDRGLAAVLESLRQRVDDEGALAQNAARSPDVRDLAKQIDAMQTGMTAADQNLFRRIDLTPQDNAASRQIDTDRANTVQSLRQLRGMDFDREYLEFTRQGVHQSMKLLDRMVDMTKNADLKSQFMSTRSVFADNLKSITNLQRQMSPGVTNMQPPGGVPGSQGQGPTENQ